MNQSVFQTIVFGLIGIIVLLGCANQQDVLTLDNRLYVIEERSAATEQQSLQFESRLDECIMGEAGRNGISAQTEN